MSKVRMLILSLCIGCAADTAGGQMRPDQPPTLSPPTPRAVQTQDVIGPFRMQYRVAGQPRVVLFWNVPFDATTQSAKAKIGVRQMEIFPFSAGNGKDGIRGLSVRADTSGYLDPAARGGSTMSAPNLAALDSAFRARLLAAQVRLIDRASTIRFMEAQHDRTGVDPKLIEADAVLGKADILLQVLLEPDEASPLRTGFKVSAIRVKDGAEIASLYTLALPDLPVMPGHYVATDSGFQWQQPRPPVPDAAEIGTALANSVMRELTPVLATRLAISPRGPTPQP